MHFWGSLPAPAVFTFLSPPPFLSRDRRRRIFSGRLISKTAQRKCMQIRFFFLAPLTGERREQRNDASDGACFK